MEYPQVTCLSLVYTQYCIFSRHRKYGAQHNQCNMYDGMVGCNAVEQTAAFLCSDWLYFRCRGVKVSSQVYGDVYKTWTVVHGLPLRKEIAPVTMKTYRRAGYEKHRLVFFNQYTLITNLCS